MTECVEARFYDFVANKLRGNFVDDKHTKSLCTVMEASTLEDRGTVVSTFPAGGKTTLALLLIAWMLKKDPSKEIIYVTHNSALAESHYDRIKYFLPKEDPKLPRSKAHAIFEEGGMLHMMGVGSGLSGYRCDFLIMDDMIGSKSAYDSTSYMKMLVDYWRSTLSCRMRPKASWLHIGSRFGSDDAIEKVRLPYMTTSLYNFPAEDGVPQSKLSPEVLRKNQIALGMHQYNAMFNGIVRQTSP